MPTRSTFGRATQKKRCGDAYARHLTLADRNRLEAIALRYLDRRIEREFWVMTSVMSELASEDFWKTAANLADASDEPAKTRASYLLQYREGAQAGEQFRKKLSRENLMRWYRQRQSRV